MPTKDQLISTVAERLSHIVELAQYATEFATATFEAFPGLTLDALARRALIVGGICYRETLCGLSKDLSEPGPAGTGDGGHGRGLMQVDDRFHADWIALKDANGTPLWQLPLENIRKGASILAATWQSFGGQEPPAVACYNCGPKRVREALKVGLSPDAYTTGHNYSTWVLKHVHEWQVLIALAG